MNFWKRQFPTILVFTVGVLMVVQYYVPHPASVKVLEESNRWVRIIQNFALLLGVASLVGNHWRKIAQKQPGFGYSGVVLIAFVAMVFFGLVYGIDAPEEVHETVTVPAAIAQNGGVYKTNITVSPGFSTKLVPAAGRPIPKVPLEAKVDGGKTQTLSTASGVRFPKKGPLTLIVPKGTAQAAVPIGLYLQQRESPGYWMFATFKVSMESTMYSLLAFFISSAAFRAFRARSVDATIMLTAAIIMMIGRVSFGEMISSIFSSHWLFFPKAASWLLDVPVTAAKRAIFLGLALSIIALSIRIIFGLERSYLGRGD